MNKEIIDTTLRDGEQAPGVSFSIKEKINIAHSLMNIGVDEIEAGTPIMGSNQIKFIKWLVSESTNTRISTWSRLSIEDVKASFKTGADTIHISMPISSYHLQTQIGSWSCAMLKLTEVVTFAKDNFEFVSLGLQDSFRSEHSRLLDVCNFAEDHNLFRIRFSDTVGNTTPNNVKQLIKLYRDKFSGKIDFHGHNDLGLGTANALTALENGADSVNVTVNGIGERAGNTSLEQLVFILDMHKKLSSKVDLTKVKDLCKLVSSYSNRVIPVDKPIVGDIVFTHESGIHSHGMQKNRLAYQPFCPEDKGLSFSSIVVGTHSGRSNIIHLLENAGIKYKNADIPKLLKVLKNKAIIKKNFLTSSEVINIYKCEVTSWI
ncbi:MAG: hypothetical protein OCD02_05080 [Spirochaetaceae bacterium]